MPGGKRQVKTGLAGNPAIPSKIPIWPVSNYYTQFILTGRYTKLASLEIESPECSDSAFEAIASNYLKVRSDH